MRFILKLQWKYYRGKVKIQRSAVITYLCTKYMLFFQHTLFLVCLTKYHISFTLVGTTGYLTNRYISQIPQCIRQISHNAPFCNRNVYISVTEWRIVGYMKLVHSGIYATALLGSGDGHFDGNIYSGTTRSITLLLMHRLLAWPGCQIISSSVLLTVN